MNTPGGGWPVVLLYCLSLKYVLSSGDLQRITHTGFSTLTHQETLALGCVMPAVAVFYMFFFFVCPLRCAVFPVTFYGMWHISFSTLTHEETLAWGCVMPDRAVLCVCFRSSGSDTFLFLQTFMFFFRLGKFFFCFLFFFHDVYPFAFYLSFFFHFLHLLINFFFALISRAVFFNSR